LNNEPQFHIEAALAALLIMSLLFAVAGLANLMGIVTVELTFFKYSITSRLGIILWTVVSLLFAFIFGYVLRNRCVKKWGIPQYLYLSKLFDT